MAKEFLDLEKLEEARDAVKIIGYPVRVVPAFALGDFNFFANDEEELIEAVKDAIQRSPTAQFAVFPHSINK